MLTLSIINPPPTALFPILSTLNPFSSNTLAYHGLVDAERQKARPPGLRAR